MPFKHRGWQTEKTVFQPSLGENKVFPVFHPRLRFSSDTITVPSIGNLKALTQTVEAIIPKYEPSPYSPLSTNLDHFGWVWWKHHYKRRRQARTSIIIIYHIEVRGMLRHFTLPITGIITTQLVTYRREIYHYSHKFATLSHCHILVITFVRFLVSLVCIRSRIKTTGQLLRVSESRPPPVERP